MGAGGTARITVVLADDHTLVRAGLRSLLASLPDVEVVAEAEDGRAALAAVATHRPRILLLDLSMPGVGGLEIIGRIAHEHPGTRCVVLSMHASEEYVVGALRAGAAGYVLKGAPPAELEAALRAVARGDTYLSPETSRHLVADYRRVVEGHGSIQQLSPRQREVLRLIAEGLGTKAIAARLQLSVKTVETHRAQLMERLGIRDVAGLVRYAIRSGILAADD